MEGWGCPRPSGFLYNAPVIELKDVTVERDGRVLCEALDWQLPDPGTYLLLGPNGSGKTLLCRLLSGRLKPQRGQVLVDGRPVYGRFGGRCDCWTAQAEHPVREDEPLAAYLEQELLRAGGRSAALTAVWPLLEAHLGGRQQRVSSLSHGQALLTHFALAASIPQRLVILDGHLSYLDPNLGQAAAQLLHAVNTGQERFLLLTASRLADNGLSLRKVFALDGSHPIQLSELNWERGCSSSAHLKRHLVVYPAGQLGPAWRLTSGSSFTVVGELEGGGWQVRLLGSIEQFLEEMREHGVALSRLEWEGSAPD